MKNRFKFIIIMVMAIVCTMTANAQKYVYFATHRFVQDEYGETSPKKLDEAYCPTRIEVDKDAKTLLVKTKTHGRASYTFSNFKTTEGKYFFYDTKGNNIGCMFFYTTDNTLLSKLIIYRCDDTIETYESNSYKFDYLQYCKWRECVNKDFEKAFIKKEGSKLYRYYDYYDHD